MTMGKVGFHFLKAWADFNSVLPYWLLYLKSDLVYVLTYHVAHYRRKVVKNNLLRSFPEKGSKELKTIEKRFYHNLCDLIVETQKALRMGENGFKKRVSISNPELITALYEKGKSVFYSAPHSGNWEWFAKMMPDFSAHNCLAVYKRVKNPAFEQLMLEMRTKDCPLEMVESNSALRRLVQLRDKQNAVLMVADQSSFGLPSDYWTEFLHQDTCWFTGLERIAKKLNYAVVFVDMKRQGRGRYEVTFQLITDDPKNTPNGFIMEQYVRCVERFIQVQPDNWLWSHRRWKHLRPQNTKQ